MRIGITMLAVFVLSASPGKCRGQGTMRFTFEAQPPGSSANIFEYSESGMLFTGPHLNQLWLFGGSLSGYPDDGTGYLGVPAGSQLRFNFNPLATFSLISFDVAEYDTTLPGSVALHVVGYRNDMTIVSTDFTTDGVNDGTGPLQDFQTFYLDSSFVNLGRVDILSSRFAIDNVVISGVPEPSAGALTLLGVTCMLWFRRAGKFWRV